MRIYQFIDTHPPARRYGERSNGMRIQQKLRPLGAPSLQERAGGRLLGLLKPVDPVPNGAVVAAHDDGTKVEEQAVRVEAAPWGST